jgi:hypothetical protein
LLLRFQGSSQQWGGPFGASNNRSFELQVAITLVFQSWPIQVLQMLSTKYFAFIIAAAAAAAAATSNGISARLGKKCLSIPFVTVLLQWAFRPQSSFLRFILKVIQVYQLLLPQVVAKDATSEQDQTVESMVVYLVSIIHDVSCFCVAL